MAEPGRTRKEGKPRQHPFRRQGGHRDRRGRRFGTRLRTGTGQEGREGGGERPRRDQGRLREGLHCPGRPGGGGNSPNGGKGRCQLPLRGDPGGRAGHRRHRSQGLRETGHRDQQRRHPQGQDHHEDGTRELGSGHGCAPEGRVQRDEAGLYQDARKQVRPHHIHHLRIRSLRKLRADELRRRQNGPRGLHEHPETGRGKAQYQGEYRGSRSGHETHRRHPPS